MARAWGRAAVAATRDSGSTPRPIGRLLACATASLLGQTSQAAEVYSNDWSVDLSYYTYSEDDRVDVDSYIASVRGNLSDRDEIKLGVVLDTLTGATPTGAVQSSSITTVTGTSGAGFSTSGEAQALAPFDDTRLAVDAEWTRELNRTLRIRPNAYVSIESDYEALGGGITLEKDTSDKQTTFSFAIGGSSDTVSQIDGTTPVPLSDVQDQDFAEEGERETIDAVVGVTRIINARTIAQFNLFWSQSDGYHTDPYKVVSIANDSDIELRRIYERRPDDRSRQGFFTSWAHEFAGSGQTLAFDYRYYTDDWGVDSNTIGVRYRFPEVPTRASFLEPFGRLYHQSAADFYVRNLGVGEPVPTFVSADNRLAELQSVTIGLKWGIRVGNNGTLKLRAFRFEQEFDNAVFEENTANVFHITFTQDFF